MRFQVFSKHQTHRAILCSSFRLAICEIDVVIRGPKDGGVEFRAGECFTKHERCWHMVRHCTMDEFCGFAPNRKMSRTKSLGIPYESIYRDYSHGFWPWHKVPVWCVLNTHCMSYIVRIFCLYLHTTPTLLLQRHFSPLVTSHDQIAGEYQTSYCWTCCVNWYYGLYNIHPLLTIVSYPNDFRDGQVH